MSRIGRKPVPLPDSVTFSEVGGNIIVKGPKGQLTQQTAGGITFTVDDGVVRLERENDTPKYRANHGLMRALLGNMVHGVSQGFERKLEIIGVGYKAEVKGNALVLTLGFSHEIKYPFPDGIKMTVDKGTEISVLGIDKEKVGQVASELRGFRPPDSYKGKGVRYQGEYVRLKAGKSATA